jgi:hypothetical protein
MKGEMVDNVRVRCDTHEQQGNETYVTFTQETGDGTDVHNLRITAMVTPGVAQRYQVGNFYSLTVQEG